MCIENGIGDNWEKLEDYEFKTNVRCYRLILHQKQFDILGRFGGVMNQIDKKSGSSNGKLIMSVVCSNSRNFLNNSKNPVIQYGFWTCKCEKDFVRTDFSSECSKCGCTIHNHTNRATYLEEINFED